MTVYTCSLISPQEAEAGASFGCVATPCLKNKNQANEQKPRGVVESASCRTKLNLFPSHHVAWLTNACNSGSRESETLFWILLVSAPKHAHTRTTNTCVCLQLKQTSKLKNEINVECFDIFEPRLVSGA